MALDKYTDEDLLRELELRKKKLGNKAFLSPYGVWEISTEGDVEGRTSKVLVTERGHLGEILLRYKNLASYALHVKKMPDSHQAAPGDDANVEASGILNSYDGVLTRTNIQDLEQIFGNDFEIGRGQGYGCFRISKKVI